MSDASLNARADAGKQAMSQAEISFLEEGTVLSVSPSPGNIAIESFRLVLVPVWVASYPCEGRLYNILVNGQTGAVMGQQPAAHILGWFSQLFK
jgi:hypothetical protein